MKKTLGVLLLMIFSVMVFTSCGEKIELNGKYILQHNLKSSLYDFNANCTYDVYELDLNNHVGECVSEGEWVISGNKLTLSEGGDTRTLRLERVKKKDMRFIV